MTHVRTPRLALAALVAAAVSLATGCAGPAPEEPGPMTEFYVDPAAGDDTNVGSAEKPFRTLTHALTVAESGHTVHLRAGTYDEANGEVWPTQSGSPPVAEPNVPDGVTITTDGALAQLVGPGAGTTTSALVFAGAATVRRVAITGFVRGVLAGPGTAVRLEDVRVRGSIREGVFAYGDAEVTLDSCTVRDNAGAGILAQAAATVTVVGCLVHGNSPGIHVSGSAAVDVTGSEVYENGTVPAGSENSGVHVEDDGRLTIVDSVVRNNAYVGIHMLNSAAVTVGPGTAIHDNYVGVLADTTKAAAPSLDVRGATISANDFEGLAWAVAMGERIRIRDTAIVNNGDNGILLLGDALEIDLGTAADPGGNDYSGNDEPLILDARPARPAADGTVITISYADTLSPCLTVAQPVIGPAAMGCGGVTAISILNANNRVEVTFSP